MNELEKAKNALGGHSIAVALGDRVITSDSRGIAPMIEFIERGENLRGGAVADIIVGKAAALLFAHVGVAAVHARVMSERAAKTLDSYHIYYEYDTLVEKIINRSGDGICPMEQATENIDDPATALAAIKNKLAELKNKKSKHT